MSQDRMEFDVLIIGAGPAGLAAAIKLKQLSQLHNKEISVCVLEKGAFVGAHTLSGAVLEPRSLQELLPESWQTAPFNTHVVEDFFYHLSAKKARRLPTPSPMKNKGNYLISLGELCQFLAQQAQELGAEIYPGFAATHLLYNDNDAVIGVATNDVGVDKHGQKTAHYQQGMHLLAKHTLFAEGCRGQLSQQLIEKFGLAKNADPQTYALGLKEIWQVPAKKSHPGRVIHTVGWPLDNQTYGGSFIYHLTDNRIALGFVVGLDYKNTWMDPFLEMQQFKTHPFVASMLEHGERIGYGARALNEGGWQSQPQLTFPGGSLIGDAAGFLNVPKIKGIHTAIQSAIIAAQACFKTLDKDSPQILVGYSHDLKKSWVEKELYTVRNIRPGFKYGLFIGLLNAFWETYISGGKSPWTLSNTADYTSLKNAQLSTKINYPKPDGKLTFDKLSSVYLTNTSHAENQACHLVLKNPAAAIDVNYKKFASPETRYCPAAVYEIVNQDNAVYLQINAQNCIHCKSCDIKDPTQNIIWQAPEGGGGPNYSPLN